MFELRVKKKIVNFIVFNFVININVLLLLCTLYIIDDKELYDYQKGAISKIFKKFETAPEDFHLLYLSFVVFLIAINKDLKIYIYFFLLVSVYFDIGGFVVINIFKGKKLTKISPNKTVSGAIGSLIFSLFLIPFFIDQLSNLNITLLIFFTIFIYRNITIR